MREHLTDMSRYEILYDSPVGEYCPSEVGGIRTKTIRAGNTVEVECYPLTRIGEAAREVAIARKHQRAAQEMINRRNAEKKIRRLVEHNFTQQDWVITLTWDYGLLDRFSMSEADYNAAWNDLKMPIDEEDAQRELANWFRRVKTAMRQRGMAPAELKYIYVREITRPRVGGYLHYHFHLVLHAPGLSDLELKRIWGRGFARCDRLSWADEGPARLASYMTKQHTTEEIERDGRRVRRWAASKNLKDPVETVSDRKISRRRAADIAAEVHKNGRAIFEALYPGYRCAEEPVVKYSDFTPGAYIYARLRKIEAAPPWVRAGRRGLGIRD